MDGKKLKFDTTTLSVDDSTRSLLEAEIYSILTFKDTVSRLERDLVKFGNRLQEAFGQNEFLDVRTAILLHLKSVVLLALCRENPTADYAPYLLAAVSYLLIEDDSQADFKGLDGFEDDAKVIDGTLLHFGLTQLVEKRISEMRSSKELKIV